MVAAAILTIHFNGHNSVAIAHIHTKFRSETKTEFPETKIPSNFTSETIRAGGGRHFEIPFNGYYSVSKGYICAKFCT